MTNSGFITDVIVLMMIIKLRKTSMYLSIDIFYKFIIIKLIRNDSLSMLLCDGYLDILY